MSYVSTADINAYLGTSWEDTLIATLNTSAEIILNNLIWTTWLASWDITEKIAYPTLRNDFWYFIGQIVYLSWIHPTVIKTVDGVSLTSWDYEITGQKVFLKTALTLQTVFPYKNTIVYTAWYSTIPADIKQAIYLIVGAMYNTKNTQWLNSFSQGELSVNIDNSQGIMKSIMEPNSFSMLSSIINKYKIPLILSSWADRTKI